MLSNISTAEIAVGLESTHLPKTFMRMRNESTVKIPTVVLAVVFVWRIKLHSLEGKTPAVNLGYFLMTCPSLPTHFRVNHLCRQALFVCHHNALTSIFSFLRADLSSVSSFPTLPGLFTKRSTSFCLSQGYFDDPELASENNLDRNSIDAEIYY